MAVEITRPSTENIASELARENDPHKLAAIYREHKDQLKEEIVTLKPDQD